MSNFTTKDSIIEILDFWTCLFLDTPTENYETDNVTTTDIPNGNQIFYECPAYGKYLLGTDSTKVLHGHLACVLLCIMTVAVGSFGVITNIINLIVLPKAQKESSIKNLLIVLAVIELIVCVAGSCFSYLIISILGNKVNIFRV